MSNLQEQFEQARLSFPGKKRGFKTEWDNFIKKYRKEANEVIPILSKAIETYKKYVNYERTKNNFNLSYCAFSVWINQRRWEEEYPELENANQSSETFDPAKAREDALGSDN